MSLAIAIIAFTLGAALAAYFLYKLATMGWTHACHCSFCKHFFIDLLEKHQDQQVEECFYKRVIQRAKGTGTV